MQQITLQPHNGQEMCLIRQLAKTLNIKASVQKETSRQKRKREILDSIEKGLNEVQLHQEGKIKLMSASELLNEL